MPGQNNNRSERKKLLQQQRLEKRRNWRLQNRKKAPAKTNGPTVDDYKRTVKGKIFFRNTCSWKGKLERAVGKNKRLKSPTCNLNE